MTDAELIERVRAGDSAAFGELAEHHRGSGMTPMPKTSPRKRWCWPAGGSISFEATRQFCASGGAGPVSLLLENGKPMVALETMDAATNGRCRSR